MKYYVYVLKSTKTNHLYKGFTTDLDQRMLQHNNDKSSHTDKTDGPFELLWFCVFNEKPKAIAFEKYLKSGSGRAFINRHLI
jgi:predicted GIY-YIG superfamily endonuclease